MLLEALIAFVIAALALAGLYEGATVAIGGADTTLHYEQALSRARSRLDAAGRSRLQAGEQSGDDGGGYHYRVRIGVIGSATDLLAESNPLGGVAPRQVSLYAVDVVVSWRQGLRSREVHLASESIGPAAVAP